MSASQEQSRVLLGIWKEIVECRRCVDDPKLGLELDRETYIAFPTIGLLPPGIQRADFFLVGSEPSAPFKSRARAEERIKLGLRNHGDGRESCCVQYAVEHWLLRPGEGYYFTDLAKCTVPVSIARQTRQPRYEHCFNYINEEIDLLKPRAIVALGLDTFLYLRDHWQSGWPPVFSVLHYSVVAALHRKGILEDGWQSDMPTRDELDRFVDSRRMTSVHPEPDLKVRRSHLELLGVYHRQFGVIRAMIEAGTFASDKEAKVRVSTGRPILERER